MNPKPTIAISIGDINGVGLELALVCHEQIKQICEPLYCVSQTLLHNGANLLGLQIPSDFIIYPTKGDFKIEAGKCSRNSGRFSYHSFMDAITLATKQKADAIVTLPINKEAWKKADITFKGHTEVLRNVFKSDAIMMLGCDKLFVGLFTEHIPLKKVAKSIKTKKLTQFLLDFHQSVKIDKIAVLGLNPHAGDNGVLGDEELKIQKAIQNANKILGAKIFYGAYVPDVAFTPSMREKFNYFVAMYHDQGLAPLKALYFEESINVSLNLPIIRTSVDHGTAFDIAYKKDRTLNTTSYLNAIKEAIRLTLN